MSGAATGPTTCCRVHRDILAGSTRPWLRNVLPIWRLSASIRSIVRLYVFDIVSLLFLTLRC